ncbi:hypothetical protein [Aestuariibacter salexigens]|uniref:hypothetical protein n=1 Tax=Aestuariibacter salexigens TaxID=226010 RepID=UPI0004227914|nr:hypothetical protein [Aestuariibacter salexigens]
MKHGDADDVQKRSASGKAAAGLPEGKAVHHNVLRKAGIDPDRLSILHLGRPPQLLKYATPPWARRISLAFILWLTLYAMQHTGFAVSVPVSAWLSLLVGLLMLQAACQILVTTTERFAARMGWSHYVAGTVAEMLATLPECIVIAFLVPVSPTTAFILVMVTIYNNALVFSVYSYFLPRDTHGKFLMPKPITDAGMQVLIAGGAMGLAMGLVMIVFNTNAHPKQSFSPTDLLVIGGLMLVIFVAYLYKMLKDLSQEEEDVQSALSLTEEQKEKRLDLVYKNVQNSSFSQIFLLLVVGIGGAFLGGERVAYFAEVAIDVMHLSEVLAAFILAAFAGMSEYVILWTSHRKKEYGIALANAFGGITQLLFLIVPFTLATIAIYQLFFNPSHPDLPIAFSIPHILLVIFLFPTLNTLASLLENDHTMGILDTVIMITLVASLIMLLVAFG